MNLYIRVDGGIESFAIVTRMAAKLSHHQQDRTVVAASFPASVMCELLAPGARWLSDLLRPAACKTRICSEGLTKNATRLVQLGQLESKPLRFFMKP